MIEYVLPSTNQQIQTLIKYGGPFTYYRLCLLIVRFIKKHNYYDFLYFLLKKNKSDSELFRELRPLMRNNTTSAKGDNKALNSRAWRHINIIRMSTDHVKINTYLDFGCGKCDLTEYIGKNLGLSKSSIFGTDIKAEFEPEWEAARLNNNNIVFKYLDEDIPFDIKFDLITSFMVLHHISSPEDTIRNIHNSLNNGGLFYIKEHNCARPEDKIFADLVHSLYLVGNDAPSEKIQEQRIYYKSATEWRKIICDVGFKEIYFHEEPMSVAANYIAIYRKK